MFLKLPKENKELILEYTRPKYKPRKELIGSQKQDLDSIVQRILVQDSRKQKLVSQIKESDRALYKFIIKDIHRFIESQTLAFSNKEVDINNFQYIGLKREPSTKIFPISKIQYLAQHPYSKQLFITGFWQDNLIITLRHPKDGIFCVLYKIQENDVDLDLQEIKLRLLNGKYSIFLLYDNDTLKYFIKSKIIVI